MLFLDIIQRKNYHFYGKLIKSCHAEPVEASPMRPFDKLRATN